MFLGVPPASRLVPGRSGPDGTFDNPFLCAEVKATLKGESFSAVLETQLFPYMQSAHARYGAVVSSKKGTDGKVTLDTHLVNRRLTGVPRLKKPGSQRLTRFGSARLGPVRHPSCSSQSRALPVPRRDSCSMGAKRDTVRGRTAFKIRRGPARFVRQREGRKRVTQASVH